MRRPLRSRWPAMALAVVALACTACGGGGGGHGASHHRSATATHAANGAHARRRPPRPLRLSYRRLFSLPEPVRDPATATLSGDRFVLAGGLDASDVSSDAIDVISPRRVLRTSTLPAAQHDAQAAALAGRVYVFGGGGLGEFSHILAIDPGSGKVSGAGALPRAASDVAVTAITPTAYVIGGFDGTRYLHTILAWRPGARAKVVARLPVGLRYAAATAVDGYVLIIGGTTPAGATSAIYRFDPRTGAVRRIGHLPQPVTHGAAATIGSFAYLVGGRSGTAGGQSGTVWSIDPRTGVARHSGHLPHPASDTGVVSAGHAIVVAGGLTATGTLASVGALVPIGQE